MNTWLWTVAGDVLRPDDPSLLDRSRRFEDHYQLIASLKRSVGEPRTRRFIGPRERRCAMDSHVGLVPTFTSEAHLIPAFLGNRWFFTTEECDACNHRFGRECEDELGKLTHIDRAFLQQRGRAGLPKVRAADGSYIGGTAPEGVVPVIILDEGSSIRPEWLDDHTLQFTLQQPAFRPLGVYRSLARMAWLMMSPELRYVLPQVLRAAHGESLALPVAFWRAWYPGGFTFVRLRLWRCVTDPTLPAVVVELTAANSIITWSSPDSQGNQVPTILPPIPVAPAPPHEPVLSRLVVMGDGLCGPAELKYRLGVGSRTELSDDEPMTQLADIARERMQRPQAFPTPPQPVRLESIHQGTVHAIDRAWVQRIPRGEATVWAFSGGALAGRLECETDVNGSVLSISPVLELWTHSLRVVRSTVGLLDGFLNSGHLRVIDLHTEREFDLAATSIAREPSFPALVARVEAYSIIERDLGQDLWPRDGKAPTSADGEFVMALSQFLRQGYFTIAPPSRSATCNLEPASLQSLESAVAAGQTEVSFIMRLRLTIGGRSVDAGQAQYVVRGVTAVVRQSGGDNPPSTDGRIPVVLTCSEILVQRSTQAALSGPA